MRRLWSSVGRPAGARGFGEEFWRDNYAQPESIDCVYNASAHARFLAASFEVVAQPIASVVDLGFGLGFLFAEVLALLEPYKAAGIEPSAHAFAEGSRRVRAAREARVDLEQIDLVGWCSHSEHPRRRFDLGICTSVLQYLEDDELAVVLPVLARRLKYLYVTVPTSAELDDMADRLDFVDHYAISRSRETWRSLLGRHFTLVGARLMESRERLEGPSVFSDDLYRGW